MSEQRKLYIFETPHTLTNFLVKRFVTLARSSIIRNGFFRVAFAAGKTPTEFFAKLSNIQDDRIWSKTHIFLTDERFVGFDHPDSNYRFIKRELLDYLCLPAENIHPVPTYSPDISFSAQQYAKELRRCFHSGPGEFPQLDFVFLGIGADGHTASLFADDLGAMEEKALTVAVRRSGKQRDRISLTIPVLNAARNVFFVVLGSDKASILKNIWEGPSFVPAAKVRPSQGELIFLADRDAAIQLESDLNYTHYDEAVVLERPFPIDESRNAK